MTGPALVSGMSRATPACLVCGFGVGWPRTRWFAGALSGGKMFLGMVRLHLPRTLEMNSASEPAGGLEALGLAGGGWLVAGSASSRDRERVTSRE